MAITERVRHAKRYADIARLLVKHHKPEASVADEIPDDAKSLADDLEAMGPTFVKLGQLLSTRHDLLPPAYCEALTRLQDDVEPLSAEVVRQVLEEDLGLLPTDVFEGWDDEPLASASLGQVHRARLHSGREVVVKVQRPDAAQIVASDMAALRELASMLDDHTSVGRRFGFGDLVAQFADTLDAELDYRREASHLERLGAIVARYNRLVVPQPVNEACTRRVLTMDYIAGRKVTTLSTRSSSRASSTPTLTLATCCSPTTGGWRSSTSAWSPPSHRAGATASCSWCSPSARAGARTRGGPPSRWARRSTTSTSQPSCAPRSRWSRSRTRAWPTSRWARSSAS